METLKHLFLLIFISFSASLFSQNSKDIQAAFSKSYTLEYEYNYSGAIEALKKVYVESNYETNLRLGWLHYLSGKQVESSQYYQKAIKLMPLSIEARLGYVLPQISLNNWNNVKSTYLDILKIDPKNSTANYRLGLIHYYAKEYKIAIKYFETLANLYPFDYDSILMFAWAHYQLGKLREAKVLFQRVLLIKPNDESAQEGLSLIK